VDIYDPATDSFNAGPGVNIARDEYPMAATVGNSIYLIGGTSACLGPTVLQVEQLDLITNTWTVLPASSNLPSPLDGAEHCGAAVGTKIYYFQGGGIGVFDTATNTWTVLTASPLLSPSLFCRATTIGNQVVITGPGNGTADANSQRILVFDATTGSVTLLAATAVSLAEHIAGLIFGSVVVAGGDFSGENSVQAISDDHCAACIGPSSAVSTFTLLPVSADDAVGDSIGNKLYILGGHSGGNNTPPVLIGTP
jgi:hypothetical protein